MSADPTDRDADERALVRKLAATWHLDVAERRQLPDARIKASLLLDAIENELRTAGRYPPGVLRNDLYTGGLIEMAPAGDCHIYWKTQVSTSDYEVDVTEHKDPAAAALTLLRAVFPVEIDGIPIDWQA